MVQLAQDITLIVGQCFYLLLQLTVMHLECLDIILGRLVLLFQLFEIAIELL